MSEGPFEVDPGRPPREAEAAEPGDAEAEPSHAAGLPLPPEQPPAWLPETVGGVLDGFALFANGLTRLAPSGAPPDIWKLEADDHDALDAPLARYLNRQARIAAMASQGDLFAAMVAFGAYLTRETGELSEYRQARREEAADVLEQPPGVQAAGEEDATPLFRPPDRGHDGPESGP